MSPQQIGVLTKWVKLGLPWPHDLHEIEFEAESGPPPVNEKNKQFWSFQKVKPQTVPPQMPGGLSPVDAFLGQKMAAAGVERNPPAGGSELIRRMH